MAALLAHKTLYFQLETALSQFKAIYFSNTIIPKGSLLLSTEKDLQKQCDIIKSTSPHLIVVDSVNKIDQFENGRGADVIETKYREAIGENGPHVIFLTHLNAQGQLKGGTSLPHMGDIVALIKWSKKIKSGIEMTLSKTRYGTTDIKITMIHTHLGIENAEDAIDKMLEEDL
ncbi:MAG: hypothetical protein U9Q82_02500 [Chloroflexota bacterium]|nr:hypothetical protein [Chloroflexota bacterium]